jgi:hypothetical protein
MKPLLWGVCAGLCCFPAVAAAGKKGGSMPPLTEQHQNASATLRFHTPPGWTVETTEGVPEVTEARGDGLILRLVRRDGEVGLDTLHVDCMLVRLAAETAARPNVDYEYDFVSGAIG